MPFMFGLRTSVPEIDPGMRLQGQPLLAPDHGDLVDVAGDTSPPLPLAGDGRRKSAPARIDHEVTRLAEIADESLHLLEGCCQSCQSFSLLLTISTSGHIPRSCHCPLE